MDTLRTLRTLAVAVTAGAGVGSLTTLTVAKVVRDRIRDRENVAYHEGWRRGLAERPRPRTRGR
jgi:hypothetical protein